MLAASALDPAQRDHLCAAVRHADRLAALVEEVFEYARLSDDAGEADGARMARVDLVEEVVQCLLGLAGPLEAAGIEVEFRALDALVAETDPRHLPHTLKKSPTPPFDSHQNWRIITTQTTRSI